MTEFTEEQLAAIKKAVETCWPSACGEDVLYKLRPKPKFADDQILYDHRQNQYDTWGALKFSGAIQPDCRALTVPEMGPLVLELFNYVAGMSHTYAQDLIKRFKEVHNA